MGCKVLCLSVVLIPCLMICEHVRAQCTRPSFESRNVILTELHITAESFPNGVTVTFECNVGHKPVNSRASKSVTCQGTQWTSLDLNCTKKSCGSPPDFLHGKYETTGVLFGDNITAVCDKGYVLDGQTKYRWCLDKGWDGRDPICEVVKCVAPPTIVNGQLEDEPLESYDYLQVVSYTCNNGLSISGNSRLYCSEDGTFKPDPPKCLDGCQKPEIANIHRIGGRSPPYKLGNFIDYKCEDDYTMKGDSHIVCTGKGWNPEPPKCIGPCSRPYSNEHVTLTEESRSQNKFPHGSTVTLKCISGYKAVNSTGTNSVTCNETKWTELPFTCELVKCVAPPAIDNGQLEDEPLDSYDYNHVVSYKCNNGFSVSGSSTLRCSQEGTFKPDPPKCLALPKTTTATIVTTKASPKDDATSSGMSKWLIVLVVIIVIVTVGVAICIFIKCFWLKHRHPLKVPQEDEKL